MPDLPIISLTRDLMFSSKITAEARAAGVAVQVLRDPAALSGVEGERLLVDLNQPGAIDAAIAWKAADGKRVVTGFVSHVDVDTIAKAKSAGIDRVMPRSQFVQQLPNLLRP